MKAQININIIIGFGDCYSSCSSSRLSSSLSTAPATHSSTTPYPPYLMYLRLLMPASTLNPTSLAAPPRTSSSTSLSSLECLYCLPICPPSLSSDSSHLGVHV